MSGMSIGLLGFGEVGSLLCDEFAQRGVSCRIWDSGFAVHRHPAGQHLQARPQAQAAQSADAFAEGCDVVFSAVTAANAHAALEAVMAGLRPGTYFVDLNSVSPGEKRRMAETFQQSDVRFVEAAVLSPIHPSALGAPVLLSGPHAESFTAVGESLGFTNLKPVSQDYGTASATKMCRSVMIKGMEALVAESLLAARHYGVDEPVLNSLSNLLPREDWSAFAQYMISRSIEHGVRRAEEMREVARTVADAGLSPAMSEACAIRQDWASAFGGALGEKSLADMLDSILHHQTTQQGLKLA